MKKPSPSNSNTPASTPWPRLYSLKPKTFLLIILSWLSFAWLLFLAVDILGILDLGTNRPIWRLMFNDRPVEWTQWFLLAFAAGLCGYLSARLDTAGEKGAGRFFFLLAIGFGLMLIEDAGDIRHVATSEIGRVLDSSRLFGVPYRFVFELPYFTALAAVPVYAFFRYGKEAWRALEARRFWVAGVILYAMASFGSAMSNLGDLYGKLGGFINNYIFAGRFPASPGQSQGWAHFYLMDSLMEETIELLALTFLITATLIFVRSFREDKLQPLAPDAKS